MNRDVTGLRLAVRGLWFRRSTALIVLVLATVASAASVVAPLYARAAEESILRDTLRRADALTLAVHVSVPTAGSPELGAAEDPAVAAEFVDRQLAHPAFGAPQVSYSTEVRYQPARGEFAGGEVVGDVVQRQSGLCENLPVVQGRCPEARDEGMLSRRSLTLVGARIGDTVELGITRLPDLEDGALPPLLRITVVGAFDPVPVEGPYWAGRPYFDAYFPRASPSGLGERPPTADPMFVGPGTAEAVGIETYTLDTSVVPSRVRLEDAEPLRRQAEDLVLAVQRYQLTTESRLPATLRQANEGRELVRIAAPLAVVQLVLLSWWTLYLVVGSAIEERSPELGLAKLRGLTGAQTRRFGLAEIVLLLLVAAPLGTLIGYATVRGAADAVFAPGTEVLITWPVVATVLVALAGGVVTALFASRQVLRRSVSDLLRRVPAHRGSRRAGLVDVVVVVLAAAGVAQLVADRGGPPSPVALLAPGMVAVVGGLLAARVLVRLARSRTSRATDRGAAAALAGWAGVSRRPGTTRIGAVLAVATSLLLVGVQAWAVAERNRLERAAAETGAEVVLDVRADDPAKLLETVRAADPSGRYAMAVVAVVSSSTEPTLLALDASRADEVLLWGAPDAAPKGRLETLLRPPDLPPPLTVRGSALSVDVDLRQVDSPSPFQLSVRVDTPQGSEQVGLGTLRQGPRTYTGALPEGCATGCRLAALGFAHPSTDIESGGLTAAVGTVRVGPPGSAMNEVVTRFTVPGQWRPGAPTVGGPQVQLVPGQPLVVTLRAPGGPVAEVVHGSSPEPLPGVAGMNAVDDDGPGAVPVGETVGLAGDPTRVRVVRTAPALPRYGPDAAMVDLGLALQLTDEATLGRPQVWLADGDRGRERSLRAGLRQAGIVVTGRSSRMELERQYAGDGAVLALRLLLVCGAAAVVVAVGALLVAAYVGRRQRAYEVAAFRAVGLRRSTVRGILARENLGTVVVALACGAVTAALASRVVLPSLPQFDTVSDTVPVRYGLDPGAGFVALGGLAGLLVAVGLAVSVLQLRAGRHDRLREGVR